MYMRKSRGCLVVESVLALGVALAQSDQVPFSVSIAAESNVFKAGSEVKIRLTLRNISNEEIPCARNPGPRVDRLGEFFAEVEVRDSKGNLAPETKYYRLIRGKADPAMKSAALEKPVKGSAHPQPQALFGGSVAVLMLKPGESQDADIVVSKLYDLTQPGEYTISAARRFSQLETDPRSKIIAKSNTLTISIIR